MRNIFKLNKETNEIEVEPIHFPTDWKEVNLGNYQKLRDYYKGLDEMDGVDFVKIISILSDYSEDEVRLLPVKFIGKITEQLGFLKEMPNPEIKNQITINGETYYLNPMEDMKFGEFVDVNLAMKNDENDYASILAILCRKANEKYDQQFISKMFDKRVEMFKNISVVDALSVLGFFLKCYQTSKPLSQDSINHLRQEVELSLSNTEDLLKNGHYNILFTSYAKIKLKRYKKLLKQI